MTSKVSIRSSVKSQVPQFVLEDHPLFVTFLESYYEYLEQTGMSVDYIRNSLTFLDADSTLDTFLNNFFEEVKDIPTNIVADKRLFAKHAYDLYKSKGTINGVKLLFRILYNEEIDVYLPKLDMLRISDGKWLRDFTLRVRAVSGDPFNLVGVTIRQDPQAVAEILGIAIADVAPASAIVENVVKRTFGTEEFFDVFINPESILGTFDVNQFLIASTVEENVNTIVMTSGFPTNPKFLNQGSYYRESQRLSLYDSEGQNFDAFVNGIGSSKVDEVFILDRGFGYSVGDFLDVDNNGSGGGGLSVKVAAIGQSGEIERLTIDNFGQGYTRPPKVTGPTGKFLAFGTKIGRITSVEVRDPGFGFNETASAFVPTTCFTTDIDGLFFQDEQIEFVDDSIILETGYSFVSEDDDGLVLLNETSSADQIDATVRQFGENQIEVSGVLLDVRFVLEDSDDYLITEDNMFIETESSSEDINNKTIRGVSSGITARILSANPADISFSLNALNVSNQRYLNVDGKVSEASKRIQDSRFYQDFSYVINSGQSFQTYKNVLLKLMHPAGLAVFGAVRIESRVEQTLNLVDQMVSFVRKVIETFVSTRLTAHFEIPIIYEAHAIVGPTYKRFEGFKFLIPSKTTLLGGQTTPLSVNINHAYNTQIKDWGNVTFDKMYVYDEDGEVLEYKKYRIFRFNESYVKRIYETQVQNQVLFGKTQLATTVSLRNSNSTFGGTRRFLDQNKFSLNEHDEIAVGTNATTIRISGGSIENRAYQINDVADYPIEYFGQANYKKRSRFVYPVQIDDGFRQAESQFNDIIEIDLPNIFNPPVTP